MSKTNFVLAIGIDFAAEEGDATPLSPASLPKLGDTLRDCGRKEKFTQVSPTTGMMEIDKYEAAEELICRLSAFCTKYNSGRPKAEQVCFFATLCWNGEGASTVALALDLLTWMMSKNRPYHDNLPLSVLITDEIYQAILPRFKDLYHSPIEALGFAVHVRFREDAPMCLVISPIGEENSQIRRRADEVFEMYIKPACEYAEYQAVRGDCMRGDLVFPELVAALQSSRMVIAYLGCPKEGWNPNVMYELGIRKETGLPLIVLMDATVEGKSYNLPFDLMGERVVELPEMLSNSFDDLSNGAIIIRTIRESILNSREYFRWMSVYPIATIEFAIGSNAQSGSKFTDSSGGLEKLFELSNIKSRSVVEVFEHLKRKMPANQYLPFIDEQQFLLGSLLKKSFDFEITLPRFSAATVPIIFAEHRTLRGRAFLPVITSYRYNEVTSILLLNTVYIDVTAATKLNKDGYYACCLGGNEVIQME
jgi:hypothetical protein